MISSTAAPDMRSPEGAVELLRRTAEMRKDAEWGQILARKDAELARRDAELRAKDEELARIASINGKKLAPLELKVPKLAPLPHPANEP